MLADDLDEPRAPLGGERSPARVLERRDRVEEGRWIVTATQLGLEGIGIETFVIHLEGDDLGSFASEDLERAVVARRLDEDSPRPARELLSGIEHEPLKAADREDDASRLDAVACSDPLAKRLIAASRPVREHTGAISLRDRVRTFGELRGGDQLGRRSATGEGNRRVGHAFEPTRSRCRRRSTAERSSRAA